MKPSLVGLIQKDMKKKIRSYVEFRKNSVARFLIVTRFAILYFL